MVLAYITSVRILLLYQILNIASSSDEGLRGRDPPGEGEPFECFTCAVFRSPSYFSEPCRRDWKGPCPAGRCLSFDISAPMASRAFPLMSAMMDATLHACEDELPPSSLAGLADRSGHSRADQSLQLGCQPLNMRNAARSLSEVIRYFMRDTPLAQTLYLRPSSASRSFACSCNQSLCNSQFPPSLGMPGKENTTKDAIAYWEKKPAVKNDTFVNYLLESTFGEFKKAKSSHIKRINSRKTTVHSASGRTAGGHLFCPMFLFFTMYPFLIRLCETYSRIMI